MIRVLIVGLLLLPAATPVLAQSDVVSARSVLEIRCYPPGGETRATGFVWPEPGYMVTALHAVAGCENGIVLSESAGLETTVEEIVAVDREPDLALVRLGDDLGLPAMTLSDGPPDVEEPHWVWGYPSAVGEMIRDNVRFTMGLSGALTTLGRAYSSEQLQQLYRTQDYPNRDTQILRISSLIQHGQSGAPILDAEGHVIAIADGGLLGGYLGMNWSIPAHVYLPDLRDSEDIIPREASQQALLMSSYAVREQTVVQLGDPAPEIAPEPRPEPEVMMSGGFQRMGQLPLGEVLYELDASRTDTFTWMFDELDGFIPEDAWNDFAFEVLEDPQTESWIIVPARARVATDQTGGALEAVSSDGAAVYAEVYLEAESFDAALREGLARLGAYVDGLSGADTLPPDLLPDDDIDRTLEFVDYWFFHEAPDGQAAFDVVIQVNGPLFSGRVVHSDRHPDDMTDADWMDYLLMKLAAYGLNSFEDLIDPYDWIDLPGDKEDAFQYEPSALRLVRRVPLVNVARDFVIDQDFAWKGDLAYLRSVLSDPSDFDALRFDIYEDRATGATVAVPEGLELAWNPELGAVEGLAGDGRVHLAIALHRGESFDDITGDNVLQFIESLSELAYWNEQTPADCEPDIDVSTQRADCWGYFPGTDVATGAFADLYLGLTAQEDVFLGTSVYIVGEEEDLGEEEIIAYLMMLIGAEYLSDFAVH